MYFSPDSALIKKKGPLYTRENKMSNILDLIYFISDYFTVVCLFRSLMRYWSGVQLYGGFFL